MKFEERLLSARKNRGMSQEILAEKIGVSRQAVSKWETGDAQPDYTKLIALADALEVSLDYLCGREEVPVNNPEMPAQTAAPKKRKVWPWLVGILAALILVGVGLLIGWQAASAPRGNEEPAAPYLPNTIEISGVTFHKLDKLHVECRFISNVVGDQYDCQIHFEDLDGTVRSVDAKLDGGFYSGMINLPNGWYSVSVTVSNGVEIRAALLARSLKVEDYTFTWQ